VPQAALFRWTALFLLSSPLLPLGCYVIRILSLFALLSFQEEATIPSVALVRRSRLLTMTITMRVLCPPCLGISPFATFFCVTRLGQNLNCVSSGLIFSLWLVGKPNNFPSSHTPCLVNISFKQPDAPRLISMDPSLTGCVYIHTMRAEP
jgi:hypothetical protein